MYNLALVLSYVAVLVKGEHFVSLTGAPESQVHDKKKTLASLLCAFNSPATPRHDGRSASVHHRRSQSMSMSEASRKKFVHSALAAAIGASISPNTARAAIPPQGTGDESIMSKKAHGTTAAEVQQNLRFGVNRAKADRICSYNRMFAETEGYWRTTSFATEFIDLVGQEKGPVTFYDSVTGKPLFRAPIGRSAKAFLVESMVHGWPSFRDEEVVWDNMRVLRDGEAVSVDGTHLGHNLPDRKGNRYCINLVSVSGQPA